MNPTPRIGIIGAGAIGGFYGLMLARAGYDVHFLLRSEYRAVLRDGLQLNSSVHGNLTLESVQAYQNTAEMPACDWLLVCAKTTSNAELAPIISQVASAGAKVVMMQNGLGIEDELRPLLPDSLHLLAGLCYICAHRSGPGVVEHQSLGNLNLVYHSGPKIEESEQQAILSEGCEFFKAAGLDCGTMANLNQARWQKLVWNAPYNGLSALLDSDTRAIMQNADSRALAGAIMQEVVDVATACGYQMPNSFVSKLLAATDRMPDYLPSMYHDFALKRPMELHAIYEVALQTAREVGIAMPRTEMLYQSLRFLAQRP
ncbi:putative 2-dehydropantoate 2-reductase [Pseudomonas sp. TTU2014-080ASC]|uniref:putative 2-dehydropantoate 2-reductase n=1 Tax=Pseudomonas sp. TTU2014-080ASC TaxID=1729724 RepID=UPI00071893E9|nr:putative 2-dehydropantoate 2-reductase [Pseudomonas sp. TTU2014-080ASC]KRW61921.1 2-dehydropantoate 2-reductase [Pseudomonas sp. TTU2014-080ASC]